MGFQFHVGLKSQGGRWLDGLGFCLIVRLFFEAELMFVLVIFIAL